MSGSRVQLWLGAFTGFYRPKTEEVARLDVVSRFLYAARSVIVITSYSIHYTKLYEVRA